MIEVLLGVSGSVIALLLGMIGYFLKQVHQSVNTLESTVHVLLTAVEVDKVRHEVVEGRLKGHDKRIHCLENK